MVKTAVKVDVDILFIDWFPRHMCKNGRSSQKMTTTSRHPVRIAAGYSFVFQNQISVLRPKIVTHGWVFFFKFCFYFAGESWQRFPGKIQGHGS